MAKGETLFEMIHSALLEEIRNGKFSDGTRLPTEMEITQKYFVSRVTAKRALNTLAEEGLITRVPGRGSFVKGIDPAGTIKAAVLKRCSVMFILNSFSGAFGTEMIQGAIEQGEEEGLDIIIKKDFNSVESENRMLKEAKSSGAAGVILQPANGEMYSKTLIELAYAGFPVVMVDRYLSGLDVPFVGIDNEAVAKDAVTKMLDLGHRDIMILISLNNNSYTQRLRLSGYLNAHMAKGVPVRQDLVLVDLDKERIMSGLSGSDEGTFVTLVDSITEKLAAHPEVTAVLSTEYRLSQALIAACSRLGRQNEISIVGFDAVSDLLGSRLTHIRQPQKEIGAKAVSIMRQLILGEKTEKREWLMKTQWVDGATLFPPRTK